MAKNHQCNSGKPTQHIQRMAKIPIDLKRSAPTLFAINIRSAKCRSWCRRYVWWLHMGCFLHSFNVNDCERLKWQIVKCQINHFFGRRDWHARAWRYVNPFSSWCQNSNVWKYLPIIISQYPPLFVRTDLVAAPQATDVFPFCCQYWRAPIW